MARIVNLSNLTQFAAVNLTDGGYHHGPKIIPNACQVTLNWTLADAKVAHNVLYAGWTGTPALSATVAESIRTAITTGGTWTALAAYLGPASALASVTVLDVRSVVATAFNSTGAAAPGTSASPAFPDEVAAVITLRTATRGPSGRGRIYIPGWAGNANTAAGVIVAAAVTALGAWAQTVSAALTSNLGPPVLGLPERDGYTSPATGRVFPHRDATTRPITQLLVRDNHWDSQRRRGLK